MGIYKKEVFKKDKKGNWNRKSCSTEKIPHSVKFWGRSNMLERKSKSSDHTYLNIRASKTGLSKQVSKATTFIGDTKEVRTLITTANKLPKKYKGD